VFLRAAAPYAWASPGHSSHFAPLPLARPHRPRTCFCNNTQGDQLFDVICVGIHLTAVAALRRLDAGALYFWIKDLTQEFLKLSIIYSSVEIFDKVEPAAVQL